MNAKVAELGENIVIRRFTRYQVGEQVGGDSTAAVAPAPETAVEALQGGGLVVA